MWDGMHGQADIGRVSAHFDRERDLGNELPGIGADDAPPRRRCVLGSKSSLVKPSSRPIDNARPLAAHGNTAFRTPHSALWLRPRSVRPGDLWIGVGHGRNHACIEEALAAGGDFRGNLGFVRGLVCQHGLANHIADGEYMRHVGAHLPVGSDEAARIDLYACFSAAMRWPLGERPTATNT